MISTTAIIGLSGLAGWLIGLISHSLRAARWRDPAARLAWSAGAGVLATGGLMPAAALSLLIRPAAFLLIIAAVVGASARAAWRASELLRVDTLTQDLAPGRTTSGETTPFRP